MPFWLIVLVLVTLIALCWGGGFGVWRSYPAGGPWLPGLMGILGLILLVVLVIMFVGGEVSGDVRTH